MKLIDELEHCPDTSFERDIVCEEEDSFLLSTENMQAMKKFHEEVSLEVFLPTQCLWNMFQANSTKLINSSRTSTSVDGSVTTVRMPLHGSWSDYTIISPRGLFTNCYMQIWPVTGIILNCSCSLQVTWLIMVLIPAKHRLSALSQHTHQHVMFLEVYSF